MASCGKRHHEHQELRHARGCTLVCQAAHGVLQLGRGLCRRRSACSEQDLSGIACILTVPRCVVLETVGPWARRQPTTPRGHRC